MGLTTTTTLATPETVVSLGWRDEAVKTNVCTTCFGWGTCMGGADDEHRTCPRCRGTGHEQVTT